MTDQKKRGRKVGDKVPGAWISGPDETRHEQHIAWRQQKNQAQYRGEEWEIDFEDFILIWGTNWENRGRRVDQMCMTRIDPEKPWVNENIQVIIRKELFSKQSKEKCLNRWGKKTRSAAEQEIYLKNKEYREQRKEALLRLAKGEE